MSTRIGARFCVSGRVQGVGFRHATKRKARALGLDGTATNCEDGTVDVLAAGPAEVVELLCAWLAHGPPSARVAHVERQPFDPAQVPPGFSVR